MKLSRDQQALAAADVLLEQHRALQAAEAEIHARRIYERRVRRFIGAGALMGVGVSSALSYWFSGHYFAWGSLGSALGAVAARFLAVGTLQKRTDRQTREDSSMQRELDL